jgi:hypothetical protein
MLPLTFRPWPALGVLAFSLCTALHVPARAGEPDPTTNRSGSAGQSLTLTEYIRQIDPILLRNDLGSSTGNQSARQVLESNRSRYAELRGEVLALRPPAELRLSHAALVQAYSDSIVALTRYLQGVPASAPASESNTYLYRDAENAYAVSNVVSAGCEMDLIARDAGLTLQATRSCANVGRTDPAPDNALGTPLTPLSTVTLRHEALVISTPSGNFSIPRVRYTVGRIYAKAGTPFVFNFINNNPAPFLFNLAVYQGKDEVLKRSQLVASTVASSGPGVLHTLSLNLRPGVYSFVDNVHPEPMRGTLYVVE